MADKEISALPTSVVLNPTDWFHIKQGAQDVKMTVGTVLTDHLAALNPHGVTKTQVGLGSVTDDPQLKIASDLSDLNDTPTARTNLDVYSKSETDIEISNHGDLVNNPHSVTKAQVGLSNVDDYPTSTNPNEDSDVKFAAISAVASVSATVTANALHLLPKGAVIMWAPSAGAIPSGFALCNGQTVGGIATPNLLGLFPRAGTVAQGGSTGGANSVDHGHSGVAAGHALTVGELPPHDHPMGLTSDVNGVIAYGDSKAPSVGIGGRVGTNSNHIDSVGSGQPHDHPVSVDNTVIPTVPEYYTLAFIMKYI